MVRAAKAGTVDSIGDELECPGCAYSLRGLLGALVTCPECGMTLDRAAMITARWTGRWHQAPGFSRLLVPVAWAAIAPWILLLVWAHEDHRGGRGLVSLCLVVTALAGWCFLLARAHRALNNGQGLWLSLLAHALLIGYVGGVVLAGFGVVTLIEGADAAVAMACLFACVSGVGVIAVCRHGERFIASRCIRQHLLTRSRR